MRVNVICCSPRILGNSEILADVFIKGAKEAGHEVNKVALREYKMSPCMACDYCRHHDSHCALQDDANTVIQTIIDSDVTVFAAPVYFYSLPAQLKILFDRFFAREMEIRNSDVRRKFYLILTSGSPEMSEMLGAIESYRGFIKVMRTVDDGGFINGLGAFKKGDAAHHSGLQEAYEAGLNL